MSTQSTGTSAPLAYQFFSTDHPHYATASFVPAPMIGFPGAQPITVPGILVRESIESDNLVTPRTRFRMAREDADNIVGKDQLITINHSEVSGAFRVAYLEPAGLHFTFVYLTEFA